MKLYRSNIAHHSSLIISLADTLRQVDYAALPISDYSRNYILRMLPALEYYLAIYHHCLDLVLDNHSSLTTRHSSLTTLVDYGGGHGFFSLVAKQRGVGEVIYIDYNPQAAETVRAIGREVGVGPDVVLTGDDRTLRSWCEAHGRRPDLLMGMDVIEHIYRLDTFFANLHALNPRMQMLFTTGSTPYNPLVRRRLHRVMDRDEYGDGRGKVGFLELRRRHIREHRPELTDAELDCWARATRGLNYEDTLKLNTKHLTLHTRHNTCDPATSSWTERILPLSAYRRLAAPCWQVQVQKGFYNPNTRLKSGLNRLLRLPGTLWLSPFIILTLDTNH